MAPNMVNTGRKLLIIGAGYEQLPAIKKAQELGYLVVSTDIDPQAVGRQQADIFAQVSTADKAGNLHVAQQHQIDGVMTLGSEVAVPVVAHIAEQLGLPGFSTHTAFHATNKNAMHEAFAAHEVPTPATRQVNSTSEVAEFIQQFGLPVVLKPSDNSGQRGITKVTDLAEADTALAAALKFSRDSYAIIEQFVEGPEINVTAAIQAGEICFLSLSQRVTAAPPHFGIAVSHQGPPSISERQQQLVKDAAARAIRAVGLENGIAYPQIIVNGDQVYVLEIAARIPGGYMREVGLLMSGIDMIEVAIQQAMGQVLSFAEYRKANAFPAVWVKFLTAIDSPMFTRSRPTQAETAALAALPGVYLAQTRLADTAEVPELTSSAARYAAIIVAADSKAEVNDIMHQAFTQIGLNSDEGMR